MRLPGRKSLLALALLAGAAGVWIAGAKLGQHVLLRGLSAEIASNDTDRALIAIAELEQLDARGVPVLVKAANHSDERVATAAQNSLAMLLARWGHESEERLASSKYAPRLSQLAAALDESTPSNPSPPTADWAHRTAEKLLHLAARIPPGNRLALIQHCEAVLDRTAGQLQAAPLPIENAPELADVPAGPIAVPTAPNALRVKPSPPVKWEPEPPVAVSELKVVDPLEPLPPTSSESIIEPWQPHWNAPEVTLPLATEPPKSAPASPQIQLAEVADRELLAIWLLHSALPVADSIPREMISLTYRSELATRGYRDLRAGIVLAALSNRLHDRVELVNRLLTSSVGDAPVWLLILARDESPQVRRAAISALLTCRDHRILKVIHDLALHDTDPQVAALAPQIGKLLR